MLSVKTPRFPVFETPESRGHKAGQRPVDLDRLAEQTGGDRLLGEEVLQLFLRQAKQISLAVGSLDDTEGRRRHAHTLKGAARAIGAEPLAARADAVENDPDQPRHVTALVREIDRTCDYINSLLR